jgi:hypothetical protein
MAKYNEDVVAQVNHIIEHLFELKYRLLGDDVPSRTFRDQCIAGCLTELTCDICDGSLFDSEEDAAEIVDDLLKNNDFGPHPEIRHVLDAAAFHEDGRKLCSYHRYQLDKDD